MSIKLVLSFHGDEKIKKKYLDRVKAHEKADNIIQGIGWSSGKGCAVGCTLEHYDHSRYPIELGVPEWLARLEDTIFEGLPLKDARKWPKQFLESMPVGVSELDFDLLRHKLAIKRQKRNLKLQEMQFKNTPEDYLKKVISAIKEVIKYHENPLKSAWSAAQSAAQLAALSAQSAQSAQSAAQSAAESAAWSAAESAAWSAAQSAAQSAAWSAAQSAQSAEWSDIHSAAQSAAYKQEAKDLLNELKKL